MALNSRKDLRTWFLHVAVAGVFLFAAVSLVEPTSRAQEGLFNSSPQDGHLVPPPRQSGPTAATVEVLSSVAEGVDLKAYVQDAYVSVMRNLVVKLPTGNNEKERVVAIRVRVKKDGSLAPEGSVVIVSSSGTKSMEAAARGAIRSAAPFGHLPDSFKPSNLDLLFTFYFKGSASEPKQEPKTVPLAT
jgi:hypothetical protein